VICVLDQDIIQPIESIAATTPIYRAGNGQLVIDLVEDFDAYVD
jgi:hypothetical protein